MKVNKETHRSNGYVGTINLNDSDDLYQVETMREYLKLTPFRIKLAGRLGPNNPNAWKYKQSTKWKPYQTIRLSDANFADIYVYRK